MNNKNIIKKILNPIYIDTHTVTTSGNGAVVYVPKKFVGRKAYVVIEEKD